MSGPTATGRFIAISLGIVCAGFGTAYMLSDFELVKRLDDPSETNHNRAFRVRFEQSEPLRLKPEAQKRLMEERETLLRIEEAGKEDKKS